MTEYFLAGLNNKALEMNLLIINVWNEFPQYFNDNSKISALFGSFDNCCWNGGRENTHPVEIIDCVKTIKKINNLGVSVRFTFTNSLITEKELNDKTGNLLMNAADNGMNGVILSSEILHEYLKNKYPNFEYIYSTTNCSLNINDYYNDYDISVIDYRLNKNKDFLSKLDKSKIEILVDDCCPSCEFRKQHFLNISKLNLGLYEPTNGECLNKNNLGRFENPKFFFEILLRNLNNSLTYEEIEEYKKNGFNKFKLTGRSQGRKFLLDSYIYYLVKPQFRHEVRKILQDRVNFRLYDDK